MKGAVITAVVHGIGIAILNTMGYLLCKTSPIMFAVKILYVSIPFALAILAVLKGAQKQDESREIRNNIDTVNNCLRWITQHFEPTENSYALRQSFASLGQDSLNELHNSNVAPAYGSLFHIQRLEIHNRISTIYITLRENFNANAEVLADAELQNIVGNVGRLFIDVHRYVEQLNNAY